jgi:protein-S-isoprenylcysteine O-methyltransferase Ste14
MKSPLNRGGLRFYLVFVALLAGTLLFNATSVRSIAVGTPLLLVGVCLHTWAKGCLRQNRRVATIGPYRFVRHPFYLANALIDTGLVVMAGWVPLMFVLPLWWLAIYIPVIRGEEGYLAEKFPDEYPAYQRRVACLVPWRRPLPYAGEGFRWDNPNIAGGEELPRAVRIAAYPLLFYAAQGLRNGGLEWLRGGWQLTAFSGLLWLYLLVWQLHRHQRKRRRVLPWLLQHPFCRVVFAAAALAAAWYLPGPRTSYENVLPLGGALLLLVSVPVYSRQPLRAVLAELVALFGAVAAGELLWLAPPIAAIYEAWILDRQLAAGELASHAADGKVSTVLWPYFYPLLTAACAAVIGMRLAGRILPYHFAGF